MLRKTPRNVRITVLAACCGLAIWPASARAIDFLSGPVLLATMTQMLQNAVQQLEAVQKVAKVGRDTWALAQAQAEMWQQARQFLAQPKTFVADSMHVWEARFGELKGLKSAMEHDRQVLVSGLRQAGPALLGKLRDGLELRLQHVSDAVKQAVDAEHKQLLDVHARATNHLRAAYQQASAGIHTANQIIADKQASVPTLLPGIAKDTAFLGQAVSWLSSSTEAIAEHADRAAKAAERGLMVGRDMEELWHSQVIDQLTEFRADPLGRKKDKVVVTRLPTGSP